MRNLPQVKKELDSDSEPETSSDFSSNSNSNSENFNPAFHIANLDILRTRTVPNLLPLSDWWVGDHFDSMYSDYGMPLKFTNLDGVHTGVPTQTTPTITPTTLRNIEQTFIELQRETERPEPHHNEAGFVPPPVDPVTIAPSNKTTIVSVVDSKAWIGGSTTITPTPAISMNRQTMLSSGQHLPMLTALTPMPPTRKNVGGRRPTKSSGISPEEEERRRVRRERNKLAAARCRKRRMDHTNELVGETDELEQKRSHLQKQIHEYQCEKEQLELILEAHKLDCRLGMSAPPSPPELKPLTNHMDARILVHNISYSQPRCDAATLSSQPVHQRRPQLGVTAEVMKPSRPNSLSVASKPLEIAGIPITTPSSVLPFNFDSLMDGGTGLTPLGLTPSSRDGLSPMIPSCSSQQRNNGPDVTSPDASFPPKLVSL